MEGSSDDLASNVVSFSRIWILYDNDKLWPRRKTAGTTWADYTEQAGSRDEPYGGTVFVSRSQKIRPASIKVHE